MVFVRGMWRGREGEGEGKTEVREEKESWRIGDSEFQQEGR